MKFGRRATCIVLIMALYALPAAAWNGGQSYRYGKTKNPTTMNKLAAGVMWHPDIPGFTEYPLEEGDLSYKLIYEYHEGIGFWQLGLGYVPSPENKAVDQVLTPEINLVLKDGIYHLGVGALMSYVEDASETDWTGVYWQILAGIEIPLGSRFGLGLHGHYIFEDWDSIKDSDKGGFGYSALVSFSF